MGEKMVLSGNYAVAYAAKLCKPAVVAAYPITPQTTIVEKIADFVNNGEMQCEYIRVESEHTALSACYGAEATGVRTFTASSSQGLALMHEILYACAGARLPVGMAIVNRTLAAPINIMAEWNDIMPERDSGWIITWCESGQEVVDSLIMNYRVGEDKRVLLPQITCLDAYILSHTYEPVDVPLQKEVDDFLPPLSLDHILDVANPLCFAPLSDHRYTPEFRWNQEVAMQNARKVIREVMEEFYQKFGRRYGNGLIETYRMEDAEVALLSMGTNVSTARIIVNQLREQGEEVGLIRIRSFKPFPTEELREVTKNLKTLGVLERCAAFGSGGPVFMEVRSALYGMRNIPNIIGFIAGLGGRDINLDTIRYCYNVLLQTAKSGEVPSNFIQPGGIYYDHIDVRKE